MSAEAQSSPEAVRRADRREWLTRNQSIFIAYALAIILWGITSLFASDFATWNHTKSLLTEACFVGIVAAGQTFVIISGGVDLSVPWMLNSVATLLTLWTHGHDSSLVWVVPVLLAGAAGVGLINGVGVTVFGVQPIIMTLGMNGVLEGGVLLITSGGQSPNAPHTIAHLSTGTFAGIPIAVLLWAVLAVLAWLALSRTPFGRKLYAVGTNGTVARLSGVRVGRVTITSYVISALCSAIAGILLVGYVGQAYLGMGDSYLFTSVAAVIIGGASILGGTGNYFGTIAGALILTVLTSLLPILNLNPAALQVVYGAVILVTVILASVRIGGVRD